MGRGKIDQHGYDNLCRVIQALEVRLDWFANVPMMSDDVAWMLSSSVCRGLCNGCRAFLPWRPGIPDYSDYEEVFRRMAIDLCEAWNRAVAEAMESKGYEAKPVIIPSENYLNIASVEKPSRKLKIA